MTKEKQQEIALMRYSIIAPLVSGLSDKYSSLTAFFNDASTKAIAQPDGSTKRFAAGTIERWYRNYCKNGFDGLKPSNRSDAGIPRKLDDDIQEQIKCLKKNYPRISAIEIYRQLIENGTVTKNDVSESTINRYVNLLSKKMKVSPNADIRRYERPHINEVWCGDTSVGPYLKTEDGKKHKIFIIALIDDASRFIVGIDVFFNDNFINLMSVIKSAVAKYGRPQMFNFDNGKSFKNKQMELVAARIGSVLHYDQPYTPIQKAKIERWFRTMKDQWMAALDMRDFKSLDELRGNLFAYVSKYNQTIHSSLNGKSPMERFFSEPNCIHRLSDEEINNSFLLELERKVSKDSVISINQIDYEVDSRFADQHITLRYSPDFESIYVVESDGSLTPIRVLNKIENSFIKRDKVKLCGGTN